MNDDINNEYELKIILLKLHMRSHILNNTMSKKLWIHWVELFDYGFCSPFCLIAVGLFWHIIYIPYFFFSLSALLSMSLTSLLSSSLLFPLSFILFLSLSLSPSPSSSISISIYLSIYISGFLYLNFSLSIYLSIYLYIKVYRYLFTS